MALHAGRCRVMARFLPGIELRAHNMAVKAGLRVLAQIGMSFPVVKSKTSEAEHNSNQYYQRQESLVHFRVWLSDRFR